MAMRKAPTSLQGKLWSLYREARITCDEPNKAPSVRRKLLISHRGQIAAIAGAEQHLLAVGLEADIRKMLKTEHDDDPADRSQLLLWPDRMRSIIVDIDRAHVFVPSRGEFVDLVPTRISRPEVKAAGEYLITKGRASISVGQKLKRLALVWEEPGSAEYVAYCRLFIEKAFDADDLEQRWEAEEELRDKLKVPVSDRLALRELLNNKLAELRLV
jgi:hypothetical protein